MTEPARMSLSTLRGQAPKKTAQRVRWYGGYRGFGRADVLVEKLSQYLRQHRLTDTVYAVRLEKRAKKEFYFFLTFETPWPNQLPDEVQERLDDCPLLKGVMGPCEESNLSSFLGHEVKVKALGQCLAYRVLRLEATDDPFRPEAADLTREARSVHGEQAEQLLWYLSALGQGRWQAFRGACTALNLDNAARRLARNLRLLGHLEIDKDGERWSVTPPTTVQVSRPDGTTLMYTIGARTPAQPGELTAQRVGPPRIAVDGDQGGLLLLDPALSLAAVLPHLSGYRAGLSVVGGVSAVQHTFARFDGLRFAPYPFMGETGLYEVTAATGRVTTLLYSGRTWYRGEWYGLRYLALNEAGALLPARFDPATWRLALPADQRPPELYERALVLCSGLLPSWQGEWLLYANVRPEVARAVCERLNLPLEEAELPEGPGDE